jgi:hypothetical protein
MKDTITQQEEAAKGQKEVSPQRVRVLEDRDTANADRARAEARGRAEGAARVEEFKRNSPHLAAVIKEQLEARDKSSRSR